MYCLLGKPADGSNHRVTLNGLAISNALWPVEVATAADPWRFKSVINVPTNSGSSPTIRILGGFSIFQNKFAIAKMRGTMEIFRKSRMTSWDAFPF